MIRHPFILQGAPLVLAFGLISGCDLAPRYARSALATPARLPAEAPYPPGGQTRLAQIGWREFFVDDRLRAVIALGLKNNRDLRIAAANILEARAQYRAQRADLFPAIAAGSSANIRHSGSGSASGASASATDTGTATGQSSGSGTVRSYALDLGVSSFELDLFGRVRNLTEAAQQSYFASKAGADATRIGLISEIASAWLTLASDRDQLTLSQTMFQTYEATTTLTRARYDKGIASDLDVQQAETNAQDARYDIAHLTTQIAQDQNALTLLVGTTVTSDLLPTSLGDTDHTLAELPEGLTSTLLLNRPDVLQAEDLLKAQNANIGAARAAFFPTISLTAAAGTASVALGGLFAGGNWAWSGGGSGALTLLDFGRNRANLRYAQARRDAAFATYEKAVQTAFREIADALAQRGTIDEQVSARTARVDAAGQAAKLAEARYQKGIDSFLTTLDAQRTFYSAQQSLVTTRLARGTNLIILYQTLGGGLS